MTGGTDAASPMADTVADQACYSYQYVVSDTLGNATTYTSPDIKVDTTAPAAPTLAFSAVHQHLLARHRLDGLLPVRRDHRLGHRHRHRHRCRLGHRELRVPRSGHQLDLDTPAPSA